ncbi:GntR family transcriptional regulator [Microlunatus flavus]|uniref:DNA-binding transcriptional regulator, GntR family n=1 Tax=Microlunatus flavus TaxID=1036181 RepID=A0A1H9I9B7_9ACTN|nr:GntR family transcriptional regulator [Microlunatus flavus]SEQ71173.1 DNA-binding transcriptional regulator, GntR family [Microlunatus flavus]
MSAQVSATVDPEAPSTATDQAGRARRAADHVRQDILSGVHRVGTRLSEPRISHDLGVSRNTLREAFRMLAEERLVVHQLNRGVFVRVPTVRDVSELYDVRRLVECAAVATHPGGRAGLERVAATLTQADRAARAEDWVGVGTADIDFHRELTALGSTRIVALMQSVWNEMRLAFHVVARPDAFHGSYLTRNHAILDATADQGGPAGAAMLRAYLDEAESQVLEAYRSRGFA